MKRVRILVVDKLKVVATGILAFALFVTTMPAVAQQQVRTGGTKKSTAARQQRRIPAKPRRVAPPNEFPFYSLNDIEFKCNEKLRRETVDGLDRWVSTRTIRGTAGTLRVFVFDQAMLGADARTAAARKVLASDTIAPYKTVKRTLVRKAHTTYATYNPKRPTTRLELWETKTSTGGRRIVVVEWDIAYGAHRSSKNISAILASIR